MAQLYLRLPEMARYVTCMGDWFEFRNLFQDKSKLSWVIITHENKHQGHSSFVKRILRFQWSRHAEIKTTHTTAVRVVQMKPVHRVKTTWLWHGTNFLGLS